METTSVINLMPLGKEQLTAFVKKTVTEVTDGNVNPLELAIKLKYIQKAADDILKQIGELATTEAYKHGKTFDLMGAKVEIAQFWVKYDYSKCGDNDWNSANKKESDAKEKKKERETFLKAIKGQLTIADEETGEITTIYEPMKTGKESIKITIK